MLPVQMMLTCEWIARLASTRRLNAVANARGFAITLPSLLRIANVISIFESPAGSVYVAAHFVVFTQIGGAIYHLRSTFPTTKVPLYAGGSWVREGGRSRVVFRPHTPFHVILGHVTLQIN